MECTVLRDEMLDVLYGEADAATMRAVEEHQAVCAACRDEMAALKALRRDLGQWPTPAFGRTRVSRPAPSGARWLAAAAALVLATGGALGFAGAELRVGGATWSLHLGRSGADVERLLAEQEARHQQEIAALRASIAAARPRVASGPSDAPPADPTTIARVRDLIRESEARQAVLLNASLADLAERAEAQRRFDMARMSAGLSYLDGRTGQQVARATELMGAVLQASQQK